MKRNNVSWIEMLDICIRLMLLKFPPLLPLDLLNRSSVNMSSALNMSFNSSKKTLAIYLQGRSLSENLYLTSPSP